MYIFETTPTYDVFFARKGTTKEPKEIICMILRPSRRNKRNKKQTNQELIEPG